MRAPRPSATRQFLARVPHDSDARRREKARAVLRDIARAEGARWLLREAEVIAMWSVEPSGSDDLPALERVSCSAPTPGLQRSHA